MSPSLAQVLTQGGASASSVNPLYLLAGLAVFFLGAYSSVKAFEIYRRGRLMPAVMDEVGPSLSEIQSKEKLEKLSFLADELKLEKERAAGQNSALEDKVIELDGVIRGLTSALDNAKLTRDTLEKSNLALLKERDRLKAEKEAALLRAQKPLIKIPTKKRDDKSRIMSSKKKTEGNRRLVKVSRKKTNGKK